MGDNAKWLALMKWSMQYQDGTAPSEFKEMKEEDKEFLERVMNEGILDETERVQQILRILDGEDPFAVYNEQKQKLAAKRKKNKAHQLQQQSQPATLAQPEQEQATNEAPPPPPPSPSPSADKSPEQEQEQEPPKLSDEELARYQEELLDELLIRIDQIDNAMNLVKMQGLEILQRVMQDKHKKPSTRALAAEVVSVVVQNNPFCQDAAVEKHVLETLCDLAKDEDVNCRVKALLAISCLVRHHEQAEKRFLADSCDGLATLERFLNESQELRLQRKALFFLRYLIRNSKDTAQRVLHFMPTFVPTVAQLMHLDDIDLAESSLEALLEFCELGQEFREKCQSNEELTQALRKRIVSIETCEDQEQKEYLQECLALAKRLQQQLE